MDEKLIYCQTNPHNTDVVDITVIENGKRLTGEIPTTQVLDWIRTNAHLVKSVGTGTGAGLERKTA